MSAVTRVVTVTQPGAAQGGAQRVVQLVQGIGIPVSGGGSTPWASITGTPTTLAGYGVTDGLTQAAADARYLALHGTADAALAAPWSGLTGVPSTFAPSAHAASHATGGTDALTPAAIGALTQTTGDARYLQITNAFTQAAADALYLPLAGGTLTGPLTAPLPFTAGSATPGFQLNLGTGGAPTIYGYAVGLWRPMFEINSSAWVVCAAAAMQFNHYAVGYGPFIQTQNNVSAPQYSTNGDHTTGLAMWTPGQLALVASAVVRLQVDNDATAGNTGVLIYDVTAAALVRVSRGAADSGGTGFRVLRIPN